MNGDEPNHPREIGAAWFSALPPPLCQRAAVAVCQMDREWRPRCCALQRSYRAIVFPLASVTLTWQSRRLPTRNPLVSAVIPSATCLAWRLTDLVSGSSTEIRPSYRPGFIHHVPGFIEPCLPTNGHAVPMLCDTLHVKVKIREDAYDSIQRARGHYRHRTSR
jgi:hypothetical protein